MNKTKVIVSIFLRLSEQKHKRFKIWCIKNNVSITKQLNILIDNLLSKK